jgi:hypothetical protein
MTVRYLIIFFILLNNLNAEDFFFNGTLIPTKEYDGHALISSNCIECMAKKALREIKSLKDVGDIGIGSPGAKLCQSIKNSKFRIFESVNGQQGFCLFPDGSYVDTAGLFHFSELNKK